LAAVDFDIRGIVHLTSGASWLRPLGYPTRIRQISIQRAAQRLHFLHATTGATAPGTTVGEYVVYHANGQRHSVPLVYDQNVSEFFGPEVDLASAKLAWHDKRGSPESPEYVRLFKFTWENPRPSQPIDTLDFISHLSEAAPFLVALTAESPGRASGD
jgi:hypothetical protein